MTMNTIQLSEQTYRRLQARANEQTVTPDEIAEQVLQEYLGDVERYIEVVERAGGPSAMIKGTRISVADIVGYLRIGETAVTLASETLPHLTLAQVYAAIEYFRHHPEEIEQELAENTEEYSRAYLREHLGEERYRIITGQN
jgi:uncharacterized protein (DUF433 family)